MQDWNEEVEGNISSISLVNMVWYYIDKWDSTEDDHSISTSIVEINNEDNVEVMLEEKERELALCTEMEKFIVKKKGGRPRKYGKYSFLILSC